MTSASDTTGSNKYSREEVTSEVNRVADEVGDTPTIHEVREHGGPSQSVFDRIFTSYHEAVIEAGLEPNRCPLVEIECDHCGELFERKQSVIDENDLNFCCLDCKFSHNRQSVDCDNCGTTFQAADYYAKNGLANYCSRECFKIHCSDKFEGNGRKRVEVECSNCGQKMDQWPSKVKSQRRHFCDRDCFGEWRSDNRSGENSHNWKGGKPNYYGPNWMEQRRKCLSRDRHQCVVCGLDSDSHKEKFDEALHVHHILPIIKFIQDGELDYKSANDLKNLISLCRTCHREWEGIPLTPSRE